MGDQVLLVSMKYQLYLHPSKPQASPDGIIEVTNKHTSNHI